MRIRRGVKDILLVALVHFRKRLDLVCLFFVPACFVFHVHRALMRSITHDEAQTWLWFVRHGMVRVFDPAHYEPNNHPLHSALCVLSISLFGPGHFGLRLPALLGSLLSLLACFIICRRFLGPSLAGPLTLGLICLNPLIFDLMSLARGYSLALGFMMLAYWQCLEILSRISALRGPLRLWPRLLAVSLLMGLSVATHPYFAFGNSALAGAFIITATLACNGHRHISGRSMGGLFALTCLPGAALTGFFYSNLQHAMRVGRWNQYGMASLWDFFCDSCELMLGLKGIEHGILVSRFETQPLIYGFVTLALALGFVAAVFTLRRLGIVWRSDTPVIPSGDLALSLSGGAFMLLVLSHIWACHLWGTHYPVARFGLSFAAFFILWLAFMVSHPLWREALPRRATKALVAGGVALLFWQALLVRPGAWYTYEADTRQIAQFLAAVGQQHGKSLRVDADWVLAPCLEYYRLTLDLKTLAPIHYNDQRGIAPGYDAHVAPDRETIQAAGLATSFRWPVSGACVSWH